MDERVYLESGKVKVTDLKVSCGGKSLPLNGISSIDANLRVETLFAAMSFTALSLLALLYDGQLALLLIALGFIWTRWEYEHYIELKVSFDSKPMKIMSASMSGRECVYKIAEAMDMAIRDNRRRLLGGVSETETMMSRRLRMMEQELDTSALEAGKGLKRAGNQEGAKQARNQPEP